MKRLLHTILLFAATVFVPYAQNVGNVKFYQDGETVVITYSLDKSANVSVRVSTDGGATFSKALKHVSGDVGKNVRAGDNNRIEWDVFSERMELISNKVVFMVSVEFLAGTMSSGAHNGYSYVDLGLASGILWATCNVGATKPEQCGNYYAWGEVSAKRNFSYDNYKYGIDYNTYKKYNVSSKSGKVDGKRILDLSDDAAHVNMGGEWRMPTRAELDELSENCKTEWTVIDGVPGCKYTGPNNNYIFIPQSGSYYGMDNTTKDKYATIAGSSLDYESKDSRAYNRNVYCLTASSSNTFVSSKARYAGIPVRAVYANRVTVAVQSENSSMGRVSGGGQYNEGCEITVVAIPNNGYKFVKWSDGSTENMHTIKVYSDIELTATFQIDYQYSRLAGAQLNDHHFVDLGLPSGTMWATCNIGADNPEDYGNYYAWGETVPKQYYGWFNYKYGKSEKRMRKYVPKKNKNIVLKPEDDAAAANWGGAWRMPTREEFEELIKNCTHKWTMVNGVYGCKVIGPNGNSIFLPAAGRKYSYSKKFPDSGTDHIFREGSRYWSSSLGIKGYSWGLNVFNSEFDDTFGSRCYGYPIRPVFSIVAK